jgi:hypothetical protein
LFRLALLLTIPIAAAQAPSTLTAEAMRDDLRILRAALEDAHPALSRFTPKQELDKLFDAAAARLDGPLSAAQFYRIAAPVVVAVRCGHTRLYPPDAVTASFDREGRWLPFDFAVIDGRLYIHRDYEDAEERRAGAELLSLNGVPARQVLERVAGVWSHDGDIETSRHWRMGLGRALPRLLSVAADIGAPFRFEYRKGAAGRRLTGESPGMLRTDIGKRQRERHPEDLKPESAASAMWIDDGRLALVQMASLTGISDEEIPRPMPKFVAETFAELDRRKSAALVLDLRNNGGGDNELAKTMLAHLLDEPFEFYREITLRGVRFDFQRFATPPGPVPERLVTRRDDGRYDLTGHPNWGTQQPRAPHFAGKVFLIVNGGTFSSAAELASLLADRKRAVVIGEETGGGWDGNNSGFMPRVTLPGSKVVLQLPLVAFRLAVRGARDPRRGVMPDHAVKYSIAEVLSGKDKEMDLAIALARKP